MVVPIDDTIPFFCKTAGRQLQEITNTCTTLNRLNIASKKNTLIILKLKKKCLDLKQIGQVEALKQGFILCKMWLGMGERGKEEEKL